MAEQDFDIKIRTTADTAGVKQTEADLKRLQAEAEKGAAAAGANVGRLIAPFVSAFSAFKFIDQINVVAQRLTETSAELAKQGQQLTENAQKYSEQARGAKTEADALKIASLALRDVEAAHKRVIGAAQEELGWYDKITDALYHNIQIAATGGMAGKDAGRIAKQALDIRIAGEQQLADMARQEAIGVLRTAELYKELYEQRKNEPFLEAIGKETDKIKELREQQKAVGIENVESYVAIGKQIEFHQGLIQDITKAHKEFKTPDTSVQQLQQQLGEFSKTGERMDLTPAEQTAAREGYIRSQTALRDAQVKAEKDSRDAEAEARRKRYAGEGIPTEPKPGQATGNFNADVLEVLRSLLDKWR